MGNITSLLQPLTLRRSAYWCELNYQTNHGKHYCPFVVTVTVSAVHRLCLHEDEMINDIQRRSGKVYYKQNHL